MRKSADRKIIFHREKQGVLEVQVNDVTDCVGGDLNWQPTIDKPKQTMHIADMMKLGNYYTKEGYKVSYQKVNDWKYESNIKMGNK